MSTQGEVSLKFIKVCLAILTAIFITTAFIYTRKILIPFVISIFFFMLISPAQHWIQAKLRLPSQISLGIVMLGFLVSFTLIVVLFVSSFEQVILSADSYKAKVIEFSRWADAFLQKWNLRMDENLVRNSLNKIPLFSVATNITQALLSFISNAFLVTVFVFFFMLSEKGAEEAHKKRGEFYDLWLEIKRQISRYVNMKFFISFITSFFVFIVLILFKVDFAFMFAFFTFLLNFIPTIGSLIATLLPMPVLLLQFGFGWHLVLITGVLCSIQFAVGTVLEPKWMGNIMDLHPVTILLSLMFWGLVLGLAGMFLAVPMTAIIKLVMSKFQSTRSIAELLAGRLHW